jgi:hypothetical protein
MRQGVRSAALIMTLLRTLSGKGPLHSAESAQEKTSRAAFGESVCLSGHCERKALHSRSRVIVGLRHYGKIGRIYVLSRVTHWTGDNPVLSWTIETYRTRHILF